VVVGSPPEGERRDQAARAATQGQPVRAGRRPPRSGVPWGTEHVAYAAPCFRGCGVASGQPRTGGSRVNAFAGADRLLAVVPTLARTGLARVFSDPKEGKPTAQARQFVRDVTEMPGELNRAAKLTSLGDRPLAVVTAGEGSAAGWPDEQNDLATLSSNSVHRTVAGSTHASLINDESDAAQSSQAIDDVVRAVR